ncbi:MAG: twin-arginine translocase TatA/TatE family subunit [Candidatus Sericytochromatia bacterium]|nr:twin-arginine translocase TatA/TatE family subunit [Candidatus Sericytochromatia bacterium]
MLSFADAAVIVGLGVLLFGSQKIPELARAIRRSGQAFKEGQAEVVPPEKEREGHERPPSPPLN